MTSTRIRASQYVTFIYTGAAYSLLGDGVTSAKETFNPKITNETYIINDNATPSVDSYAATTPVVQTAKVGDAVYDYIETLKNNRDVEEDAETYIVNVYEYENAYLSNYPATKQNVVISIESFDREGGVRVPINYTLQYQGDPIQGSFNPTSKVFTAAPVKAGLSALSVGALTLAPLFATNNNWLWYTTATTVSPQTVSATSNDTGATVTIDNGVTLVNTGTGSASGSASLTTGANTITVTVVSGTETAIYTIVVTKS
jgi:hypothetical protein